MNKYAIAFIVSFFIVLSLSPFGFTQSRLVNVQILAINDFHGNLESGNLSIKLPNQETIPAGGVEFLATHLQRLRSTNPNTVVVSAGDTIGATPLLSAFFHDERFYLNRARSKRKRRNRKSSIKSRFLRRRS